MRITHISTAVIESNFDWNIVKVETDENITGYGEAFLGPGLTAVIRDFAEILKGEDPTSIDRVLRRMRASCVTRLSRAGDTRNTWHRVGAARCYREALQAAGLADTR